MLSPLSIRVTLAAALIAGSLGPAGAADSTPFVIDAIVSTSGQNAFNGKYTQEALEVFEKFANSTGGINGRPIQFAFSDDQSNPQVAVQLLSELKAKNVPLVLGSDAVAPCGAMAPLVEPNGPVMFCTSPGLDAPKGSYAFASTSSVRAYMASMARYFRLRGWKRIALLMTTDAMGSMTDRYTLDAFALPENKPLQIVAHERFNPSDINITAQIAQIKASNPDGIFAWASGPAFATALRAIYEAGLNVPVATSGGNGNPAQLKSLDPYMPPELLLGGLPRDLSAQQLGSSPVRRAIEDFNRAYAAAGLNPTSGTSPYVWDPALIVLGAFRKLGTGATAAQIHDYLENLHGFVGMNGIYDFRTGDQHGVQVDSLVVIRWDPKTDSFHAATNLGGNPLK